MCEGSRKVSDGFDPAYYSGSGSSEDDQTVLAGAFDKTDQIHNDSGPITVPTDPDVHEIVLDASASQSSSLAPAGISASGSVSASEDDGNDSAGASFAFAESSLTATFNVYAPTSYSLSADLSPQLMAYHSELTLTLTGPNGTPVIPTQMVGDGDYIDRFKQSGTLGVGTYTITLSATARDQNDMFPSASYNINLQL